MLENTVENKAKFFAQHWGQKILCRATVHGYALRQVMRDYLEGDIIPDYLQLKNLRDISDEDAIEVAKIGYNKRNYRGDLQAHTNKPKSGRDWIASNIMGTSFTEFYTSIEVLDYLRSLGYLLPWMGLPVEEIIARGWAKYKE